tara:strand:- start:241 stop:915 length:675 start_codon:yes stop_codon:yes gene_type:complete
MNIQETPQYKILLSKPMTLSDFTRNGKVIWKVVKGKYGNFLVLSYVVSSDEHFTILGEACSFYPSRDMRNGIALSDINVFNQYVKDNLDKIKLGTFKKGDKVFYRFFEGGNEYGESYSTVDMNSSRYIKEDMNSDKISNVQIEKTEYGPAVNIEMDSIRKKTSVRFWFSKSLKENNKLSDEMNAKVFLESNLGFLKYGVFELKGKKYNRVFMPSKPTLIKDKKN